LVPDGERFGQWTRYDQHAYGADDNSVTPIAKMPISTQGRAVLALVATRSQPFSMSQVAESCQDHRRSRGSARASLSRTLRRLWRAGLIELLTGTYTTFTSYHAEIDRRLARVEQDPKTVFQLAVAKGALEQSPEDYLRTARVQAARRRRNIRAMHVQITPVGRAALARLTAIQVDRTA
jgi:hypothetical protein